MGRIEGNVSLNLSKMKIESEKTQQEVFEEFHRKVTTMKRLGLGILISFLTFIVICRVVFDRDTREYIFPVGVVALILLTVVILLSNFEWSCPACGKLFRKAGFQIKFCHHCGVALVEGAERMKLNTVNPKDSLTDSGTQPPKISPRPGK